MTLDDVLENAERLEHAASAMRWSAVRAELTAIRAALERAGIAVESAPIYRSESEEPEQAAPAQGPQAAGTATSEEAPMYRSDLEAPGDDVEEGPSPRVTNPVEAQRPSGELPDSADVPPPQSENPADGLETPEHAESAALEKSAERAEGDGRPLESAIPDQAATKPADDSGESCTYNTTKSKLDKISQERSKAVINPECPLRDLSQKPGNCETTKPNCMKGADSTELHENVTESDRNCNEKPPISGTSESTRLNEPPRADSTPARPGAPSDDDRKALQRRVASYIRSSGDATQTIREALKEGAYVRPSSCNDWVSYDTTKRFLESVGC